MHYHLTKITKIIGNESGEEFCSYTVKQFCKAVVEVLENLDSKFSREVSKDFSRKEYTNKKDILPIQSRSYKRLIFRAKEVKGLTIGQLDDYGLSDVYKLLNLLVTPRTIRNPNETLSCTTPEEFMDKIRKK